LHAAGVDVNSDTAPEMAPPARSWSHWLATRAARFASAVARVVMYTSIGPEPRHGFNPAGISADCRMASVGAVYGDGLGDGLATATGALLWQAAIRMLRPRMAMSRSTKRAV
jgi:hypothetical protein